MTKKLQERAIEAAAKYVERRGYDVLGTAWSPEEGISMDVIAKDGDTVVFIDVSARTGIDKGLPPEDLAGSRQRMEIAAARWLSEQDDEELINVSVRFDAIAMLVFDENRALLRHHINTFGSGDFTDSAD